jgi:hypothetical protein
VEARGVLAAGPEVAVAARRAEAPAAEAGAHGSAPAPPEEAQAEQQDAAAPA